MKIVAIGGSAGALDAIHGILSVIPEQNTAAFAIVVHISPTVDSLLATVVGSYTRMPVREAID